MVKKCVKATQHQPARTGGRAADHLHYIIAGIQNQ